jgi:hypothetical protein
MSRFAKVAPESDAIEVTPEMIEAAVEVLCRHYDEAPDSLTRAIAVELLSCSLLRAGRFFCPSCAADPGMSSLKQ